MRIESKWAVLLLVAKRADSAQSRQLAMAGYGITHETDRLAEFYESTKDFDC